MDFFDEVKWAKAMEPVLQKLVESAIDRAAEQLAPAIKDGLDGLTIDVGIDVSMKVRRREAA